MDLALANYHFGTKENLLHEVIARRARIVHDERVKELELARQQAGTQSPSVEAIVSAFLAPMFRRLADGDAGWRHYASLVSQLDVLPKFTALASGVLDPTALHFINALRLAMPKAPEPSVYWGYMFLLGTMVQVISATGRIERLSRGLCRSDDVDAALREIVPFVSGGLRALEHDPEKHARALPMVETGFPKNQLHDRKCRRFNLKRLALRIAVSPGTTSFCRTRMFGAGAVQKRVAPEWVQPNKF